MSRLTEKDIRSITIKLQENDESYRALLGAGIREIAAYAVGLSTQMPPLKCAVVPVTSGLGVIGGFCETVCAILKHCGASAFVTTNTDVAGMWQAHDGGADLAFMADDNVCAAFGRGGIRVDNGYATGIGFAAALELMNEKHGGAKKAVVLGAGPVGVSAARYLAAKGWGVSIFDPDLRKAENAVASIPGIKREPETDGFKRYENILCAANVGAFITSEHVSAHTKISAPGVPLGVTEEAARIAKVFHNPLELGIAVMLFDCVAQTRKFRVQGR